MFRLGTGVLLACTCALAAAAGRLAYPESRRVDHVDTYHGTRVADPYRWLEDVDSSETRSWVRAQNKLSLPFLAGLPQRERFKERLTELWNFERASAPRKESGRYFYVRNDGLQNQAVLYVQEALDAPPRALLDPNKLAADGTVALKQWEVAPDGRHVAYGLTRAGSDWTELRALDVATGKDIGDKLERVKFSNIAWTKDGRGFFYSRYPDPPKEAKSADGVFETLANQKLYYHRLGEPQAQDRLILERPDHPEWFFDGRVSRDGLFLYVLVQRGSGSENALYYAYLGDGTEPKLDAQITPLIETFTSSFEPIGNEGSVLYLLTDRRAPRKAVVAVDLRAPALKDWITLIPQGEDTIHMALRAGRELVLLYMRDASHRLRRFSMDGQPRGEIALPGLGSIPEIAEVRQLTGDPGDPELFYSFTAVNRPPTTYRCDLGAGRCAPFNPPKLRFAPDDYVTTQVFFRSRDGTRVPMFISHRKDFRKNGRAPTYLFGYGGFDVSKLPEFDEKYGVSNLAWMEQGGVYALANLRGGGEYGKAWHEAGTKERKQNVFDDFIAAAEYLVKEGYTRPEHLAIGGRSNGGLLVGAVVNQRPDLFAAAIPMVGVMDMLRFHKFTIGWAWTSDYGSSDDPKGFEYLRAYSPYHNVRPGTKYPAVLVTTADHDDRVVPGHSFKYTAAMQAAQAGDRPILIRIDVKAGHGGGKPTAKLIEEEADKLAFLAEFTRPPADAPAR